jgi:hypothetical protein
MIRYSGSLKMMVSVPETTTENPTIKGNHANSLLSIKPRISDITVRMTKIVVAVMKEYISDATKKAIIGPNSILRFNINFNIIKSIYMITLKYGKK